MRCLFPARPLLGKKGVGKSPGKRYLGFLIVKSGGKRGLLHKYGCVVIIGGHTLMRNTA